MSVALIVPAVLAAVGGVVAGVIRWPVRPMLTVRLLTAVAIVVSVTFVAVVALVGLGFAAQSSLLEPLLEACPVVISANHEVSLLQGAVAWLLLVAGAGRAVSVWHRRRHAGMHADGSRLRIVDDEDVIAFAVPGDPGCVVVSRGLLDRLSPCERKVVFAHERAHLRLRHHWYLYASELATALAPFLGPLAAQIRLATERSADEAAVNAVGGDRRLVARAIARAALGQTRHDPLLAAFGGSSISLRVQALIRPTRHPSLSVIGVVAAGALAVSSATAGLIQFHHLAELVAHLCGV